MARAPKREPAPKHSRGHTAGVLGALIGLAAAGTAAGVAVSRVAARRVRAAELGGKTLADARLREDDPLGGAARAADRTALVQADDGVPRAAGNRAPVLAGGEQRTIAGRVCMDQFVLDVGDDGVCAGDEVLLFGPGDAGEPTAQDWAQALGTINYEVVTRLGARVPRVHVG